MEDETEKSWRDILQQFSQDTTFHGIRYVWDRSSLSTLRRILWLLIFLASTGIFVNLLVNSVIHYMEWPVTVKVDVNLNESLRFPAIAICNQNSFRIREAYRLGYKDQLNTFYSSSKSDDVTGPNITQFDERFLNLSMEDVFLSTAHQAEDMIVGCNWLGLKCSASNFSHIFTDHGVCYSFNNFYPASSEEPLHTSKSGTKASLKLVINVETYEAMVGPNQASGLYLLLADHSEVPLFAGKGDGVLPGTYTFISIKLKVIKRLPPPYGNCTNSAKLKYYPTYSETACYMECFTRFFFGKTGCKLPYMKGDGPTCTMFEYAVHYKKFKAEFDEHSRSLCNCKPPCDTTQYNPFFSFLKESAFDRAKILDNYSRKDELNFRYKEARDIRRMTTKIDETRDVLTPCLKAMDMLSDFLQLEFEQFLHQKRNELQILKLVTNKILSDIKETYEFQEFIVKERFLKYVEDNNKLFFEGVVGQPVAFLTMFRESVERLSVITKKNHDRRTVIFDAVDSSIRSKGNSLNGTLMAITDIIDSYRNAKGRLDTRYPGKDEFAHNLITPRSLLRKALDATTASKSAYNIQLIYHMISNMCNEILFCNNQFLTILGRVTKTRQYNRKALSILETRYFRAVDNFNGNRSVMMSDIFRLPERDLKEKAEHLQYMKERVTERIDNIEKNINSLEEHVATVSQNVQTLKRVRNITRLYLDTIENPIVNFSTLANLHTSPDTRDNLNEVLYFLDLVNTLATSMEAQWNWIENVFWSDLLFNRTMTDRDIFLYMKRYHPDLADEESFLKSSLYQQVQSKKRAKEWADLRQNLTQNADMFFETCQAVAVMMGKHKRDDEIGRKFFTDNFLSMVIFLREMNYESVEQQTAYTIFSLLSDIGGSMGLLVGGSVISIFEILDVFVYNAVQKAGQEKKKKPEPVTYMDSRAVDETETSGSECSTTDPEGWSTLSGEGGYKTSLDIDSP
ncbi:uncharacterized protein LOC135488499 [Lineus longissimus]|uniref:uncharacterized protein LOC135488499 n=1 Tax=Lineus longissimus TaxID=88925 RepID=UPI00315D9481